MSTPAVSGATMGLLSNVVLQGNAQSQLGATANATSRVAGAKQVLSSQAPPIPPPPISTPSADELKKLVNDIQRKVPATSKDLQFSVDQDSDKPVVTLTDRMTKEVLWQVPSEVALRISKELDRFQKGMLVNRRA